MIDVLFLYGLYILLVSRDVAGLILATASDFTNGFKTGYVVTSLRCDTLC